MSYFVGPPSRLLLKIGGSLLDRPDLPERLQLLVGSLGPGREVAFVVGGGSAADIVRRWDARFRLGDEAAHWLALRAMTLNLHLIQSWWPDAQRAASADDVTEAWAAGRIVLIDAHAWLQRYAADSASEPPAGRHSDWGLSHNWDTTSDSIAAWLAHHGPFEGLLLLKSTDWPVRDGSPATVTAAAAAGVVDPNFPGLSRHLPWVGCLNLAAFPDQLSGPVITQVSEARDRCP